MYHQAAPAEDAPALFPSEIRGSYASDNVASYEHNEGSKNDSEAEKAPALSTEDGMVEYREAKSLGSDVSTEEAFFFKFLEWQSTYDVTDVALKYVMRSLLPETFRHSLQSLLGADQEVDHLTKIPSLYSVNERLSRAANFQKKEIDCCVNSCIAFYGIWESYTHCIYCKEPRFRQTCAKEARNSKEPNFSSRKSRKTFSYFPVIPRIAILIRAESMRLQMKYRHEEANKQEEEEYLKDYIHGSVYREFVRRNVLLEDDILFSFSTDGFTLFEKFRHDCWPLVLLNLNLSPEIRYKVENMIPLGVISGPKAPRSIESFLTPMIEEFETLRDGVYFKGAEGERSVFLRAFIYLVTGDLPAISKLCCLTGFNGSCPCRFCEIRGRYLPRKKHIYFPSLIREIDSSGEIQREERMWDPRRLKLRTHKRVITSLTSILESKRTTTEKNRELRELGFTGKSILFRLPSIDFFSSFPIDTMHLNYENIAKNLWKLWSGVWDSSEFDEEDTFLLSRQVLQEIGSDLVKAKAHIPAVLGRAPKNIAQEWSAFTAEEWINWTLFYSPIVLEKRLPERYFKNWCVFSKLCALCHQKSIRKELLHLIESLSIEFFNGYEKLYSRYNGERSFLMRYVFHLVLHLADSVRSCGPLYGTSQFPMERFIGTLGPMIKSNSKPAENLTKHLLLLEKLKICKWRGFYSSSMGKRVKIRKRLTSSTRLQLDSDDNPRPELARYAFLGPSKVEKLSKREIFLLKRYFHKAEVFDSENSIEDFEQECKELPCTLWDRLEILTYGEELQSAHIVVTADAPLNNREQSRSRNFIAADFDEGGFDSSLKTYYGSVKKLFYCRWREIECMLSLVDWAASPRANGRGALFVDSGLRNAFKSEQTIESVEVIRGCIGVFERKDFTRGMNRLYFIDPECLLQSHKIYR